MSLLKLHLEKTKFPEGYEKIILDDQEITPDLEKKGFQKGRGEMHWRKINSPFEILITRKEKELEYRLKLFTTDDDIKELREFIDKWANENKIKGETSKRWAHWISSTINNNEELINYDEDFEVDINAPQGWNNVFVSTTHCGGFKLLCEVISTAFRELANEKFKEIENLFSESINDISKIQACVDLMYQKPTEMLGYPHFWTCAENILKTHGINEDTIHFLGSMSATPVAGLTKKLEKLSNELSIKKTLENDPELADQLFLALQEQAQAYYIESFNGYTTKSDVKKVAKILAAACNAFGFGIHPNGLITVIRLFEIDNVEGIYLDSYQSDEEYDPEEWGYYDSQENESNYYDEFWKKIDILELIK